MNATILVTACTFPNPVTPDTMCRLDTINGPRVLNDVLQGYPQIAMLGRGVRFLAYIGKVEIIGTGEAKLSTGEARYTEWGYLWSEGSPVAIPVKWECTVKNDRTLHLVCKDAMEDVLLDTGLVTSVSGTVFVNSSSSPKT